MEPLRDDPLKPVLADRLPQSCAVIEPRAELVGAGEPERLEQLATSAVGQSVRRFAVELEGNENNEGDGNGAVAFEDPTADPPERRLPAVPNATSSPSKTPLICVAANSGSNSVMFQPRRLRAV
jgi:hypothetical protein